MLNLPQTISVLIGSCFGVVEEPQGEMEKPAQKDHSLHWYKEEHPDKFF
jgi:hypothetical protein